MNLFVGHWLSLVREAYSIAAPAATGRADNGRLGSGQSSTIQQTPTLVSGGYSFSKVFTSAPVHACGLLTNQSIVCWGARVHERDELCG